MISITYEHIHNAVDLIVAARSQLRALPPSYDLEIAINLLRRVNEMLGKMGARELEMYMKRKSIPDKWGFKGDK